MSATEARAGGDPAGRLTAAIRDSGLIEPGSSGVVLLSGGPDSVSLLAGLAALKPPVRLVALHLNYGLRAESDADQAVCAEVCDRLGVELLVKRPGLREGNLQAWAREERYAAAESLRVERGAEWIAVGHTLTDVAETVVYRLASSPGRRALAAMKPRAGLVVRPLLDLTRSQTRALAAAAGLPFADDRSNEDPAYARARIRGEVMPVLTEINSGAEVNIASSRSELAEEGELLDLLAEELLTAAIESDDTLSVAKMDAAHPALRRLAIRQLAEKELGRTVPFSMASAASAWRLAKKPEGGEIDLGGGASLVFEAGTIAVRHGDTEPAEAGETALDLPGEVHWAGWTLRAERLDPPFSPAAGDAVVLDLDRLEPVLTVRGWRQGDRIQPLGLDGSKSLQDLFTDSGVPRSRRHRIPVLLSGGEVVWVAGVALGHPFRLRTETRAAVRLSVAGLAA